MAEFDALALGLEVGSGGILGAIAGYAAKKIIKIALVFVGLGVLGLKYLEGKGFITVDWAQFNGAIRETAADGGGQVAATGMGLTEMVMSMLPFGGSFAAGFMLGMKKG